MDTQIEISKVSVEQPIDIGMKSVTPVLVKKPVVETVVEQPEAITPISGLSPLTVTLQVPNPIPGNTYLWVTQSGQKIKGSKAVMVFEESDAVRLFVGDGHSRKEVSEWQIVTIEQPEEPEKEVLEAVK